MTHFPNRMMVKESMGQLATTLVLPKDDDGLVDEQFLSRFTGYSLGKLRNDRYLRRGFDFVKFGSSVRYRAGDIRKKLRERTVRVSG